MTLTKTETKDFRILYDKILLENLIILEKIRKPVMARVRTLNFVGLFIIILLVISILIFPEPIVLYLLGTIATTFFLVAERKAINLRKIIRPKFKKKIILPMLTYLYDDVNYQPRQRMSKSLLQNSLLLQEVAQRVGGDDFVKCKIGQTSIQFSDIEAYHRNHGMLFAGIFISISFNKSFLTKTIVFPRSKSARLHRLKLSLYDQMQKPSVVKLEDSYFNNEFIVISEDQVESRYILSTSLMQRLLDYKNKVNAKVAFSFVNNRLYVAVPTKWNKFEPRVNMPIPDKVFIKQNYNYFKLLTDIVEDLDLNTRIWN